MAVLRAFARARDWEQYHTPKNLLLALAGEVGELSALFQWLTPQQASRVMESAEDAEAIRQEVADVVQYILLLSDVLGIDPARAVLDKVAANEDRFPALTRVNVDDILSGDSDSSSPAPAPSPSSDAAVAEKIVALLDSGSFTTTYKFAVLLALVDVCVESVESTGLPPDRVSGRRVGQRVLELFWQHSRPYPGAPSADPYLHHSAQGNDLVTKITAFREVHGLGGSDTADDTRRRCGDEFQALEEEVVNTVIRMPLPRLQRFGPRGGSREDRFLYDYGWDNDVSPSRVRQAAFDDCLTLAPGVGGSLVRLASQLQPLVKQRWAAFVAERSRHVIEDAWLDEFLFGASRQALHRVRGPIWDAQDGHCFYCRTEVSLDNSEVDHFLPWARHPDDGLDNLVVAHERCNNAKRDSLAATDHLERWTERFILGSPERSRVDDLASELSWPARPRPTLGATRATYFWLPEGTLLWESPGEYRTAEPTTIRRVLERVA